jgi:hypothetical protein
MGGGVWHSNDRDVDWDSTRGVSREAGVRCGVSGTTDKAGVSRGVGRVSNAAGGRRGVSRTTDEAGMSRRVASACRLTDWGVMYGADRVVEVDSARGRNCGGGKTSNGAGVRRRVASTRRSTDGSVVYGNDRIIEVDSVRGMNRGGGGTSNGAGVHCKAGVTTDIAGVSRGVASACRSLDGGVMCSDNRVVEVDSARGALNPLVHIILVVASVAVLLYEQSNGGMSRTGSTLAPLLDFAAASELGSTLAPDPVAFAERMAKWGVG